MWRTIVEIIVDICEDKNITGLDYIKDLLDAALQTSEAHGLSWSEEDYLEMLDDIILELEHPGESFAEPLN